ncbi:MAG: 1-acyl-sn-glycerol-3-phosphate acyltransferase [Chitinispirillia bacterium]|nr:1-acyl-sn-glycerol-3-phosphate acyltransferase [Chitinispirillia bacterium]
MDNKDSFIVGILRYAHMVFFSGMIMFFAVIYAAITIPVSFFNSRFARNVAREWNLRVLELGGVKIKIIGKEKLDPSERYVFISNHQSALDIPIIYTGVGGQISFIAKKELFKIPVFGWGMSAIGHIAIDRSNSRRALDSMNKAVEKLQKENISLVLFPEGTRSKDGKVGEFKTASFTLAIKSGVKIVPVGIKNAIACLPPNSLRVRPGKVTFEIGDPIALEDIEGKSKGELCTKVQLLVKEIVEA